MAFGFAGAGAGASDALQELLARAFAERQAQAQLALQQQSGDRAQQQLMLQAEQERRIGEQQRQQNERQTRLDEVAATDRRSVENQRGMRRMMGDFLMQRGTQPLDQGARNQLLGMSVSEDVDLPRSLTDLPQAPDQTWVIRNGKLTPITQGTAQPGDRPYDPVAARGTPSAQEQEWVLRNNKVTPIPKGTAQPGDVPYDAVAARAQAATTPSSDSAKYAAERVQRSLNSANSLITKVSGWTSGVGSMLSAIPGTDARNFAAELNTLKANIAFGELTAMRNASKTGGALGSVAVRELDLLESTLGALDTGQSPENLKKQLEQVRDSLERWKQAQYGIDLSGASGGGQRRVGRFEIVSEN